jgi:NAD(P)-dependent dehydrogenase (short-subunit alcohol dehydrogenase family)
VTLTGRVALVTGGARGIGAAIARELAGAGARVMTAARHTAAIPDVTMQRCDVTQPDDVAALVRATVERLGPIDILVNSAGTASSAPVGKISLDEWQRLFAVNATGTLLCTQAVLPGMRERGFGRIVNVASIAGLNGDKYIAAYSAAKHAVVGFTRSLAREVGRLGVNVNAIAPGFMDTEMTQGLEGEQRAKVARRSALRRLP